MSRWRGAATRWVVWTRVVDAVGARRGEGAEARGGDGGRESESGKRVSEVARAMHWRGAKEEVMSTQSLNRIVEHEVRVRRQGRIYLMGLVVAAGVVMASLVLAV